MVDWQKFIGTGIIDLEEKHISLLRFAMGFFTIVSFLTFLSLQYMDQMVDLQISKIIFMMGLLFFFPGSYVFSYLAAYNKSVFLMILTGAVWALFQLLAVIWGKVFDIESISLLIVHSLVIFMGALMGITRLYRPYKK